MTNELKPIEDAAKELREIRDALGERATALHDELEAVKRKHLAHLRRVVARVSEKQADLLACIDAAPHLFDKPRSMVLHGIKLGFAKGKGKMDWEDDAQVVKLIRKHLPEQFDVLVKTTEEPMKAALNNLTAAELKRVGVEVESTGDVAFAKAATAEVDKLVKALLKGVEAEVQS